MLRSVLGSISSFLFKEAYCEIDDFKERDKKYVISHTKDLKSEHPEHTVVPIELPDFIQAAGTMAGIVTERGHARAFNFNRSNRPIRINGRTKSVYRIFAGHHGEFYVCDGKGMFTNRKLHTVKTTETSIVAVRSPVKRIKCAALHCAALFEDPEIHPVIWMTEKLGKELPLLGAEVKSPITWKTYQIDLPEGTFVKDLDVGDRHTLVLDQEGNVWGFGDNRSGQLGYDPEDFSDIEIPAMLPIHEPVKEIYCGEDFSAAWTESGKVILFGGLDRQGNPYEYMNEIARLVEEVETNGVQKMDACGQCMAYLSNEGDVYEFGNCPAAITRDALYVLQYRTLDFEIADEGIITLAERLWEEIRTGTCMSPY